MTAEIKKVKVGTWFESQLHIDRKFIMRVDSQNKNIAEEIVYRWNGFKKTDRQLKIALGFLEAFKSLDLQKIIKETEAEG